MRKLLALPLLAITWLAACAPLPKPLGAINDYGQTLERAQREQLEGIVSELAGFGISFVYLASWNDPFGAPDVYAAEIFQAWGLDETAVLIVFVRDDDLVWHVAEEVGPAAGARIPEQEWAKLLSQAQQEANQAQPAFALLNLAQGLLDVVSFGGSEQDVTIWPYLIGGVFGAGGVALVAYRRICPRCFHILRRRRSVSGIIWVCPHCRYTRASRWGEG